MYGIFAYIDPFSTTPTDRQIWLNMAYIAWSVWYMCLLVRSLIPLFETGAAPRSGGKITTNPVDPLAGALRLRRWSPGQKCRS